ncbi:MAG TPA: iron-containing alcohol dehydrogenase, partial [Chthonomonadaceae bacterium]|nr:iron-containing alcohol dehydrogenase [Chthonomonadaceae bacterium]
MSLSEIRQHFKVEYSYSVRFTERVFDPDNPALADSIQPYAPSPVRTVFVLDSGLCEAWPGLCADIDRYCHAHSGTIACTQVPLIVPGGERAKNDRIHVDNVLRLINAGRVCRHSYVVAVGGGALLDMAGFAASTAHRGVRLIRVPTTVLAQNDSGVGVKNSVNAFGKKNFLGAFSPPHAVICDSAFLTTLDGRDWRSGIAEAVKVALV